MAGVVDGDHGHLGRADVEGGDALHSVEVGRRGDQAVSLPFPDNDKQAVRFTR